VPALLVPADSDVPVDGHPAGGGDPPGCDPLNPCSARSIAVFGFMDLPFMAGAGFIVIAVLLAFYTKASE
jgi:hypothetical protein